MSLKPSNKTVNLLSALNEEGQVVEMALYMGTVFLDYVTGDDKVGLTRLNRVADEACEYENKALHEHSFSLTDYPEDWSWNDVTKREFEANIEKPTITIAYAVRGKEITDAALYFNGKLIKSVDYSKGESSLDLKDMADNYSSRYALTVYQERFVDLSEFDNQWRWDDVTKSLFKSNEPKKPSPSMTP